MNVWDAVGLDDVVEVMEVVLTELEVVLVVAEDVVDVGRGVGAVTK